MTNTRSNIEYTEDHPDCFGKEPYTKKEAQTKVNFHKKVYGRILRSYECPNCGKWHLTHTKKY